MENPSQDIFRAMKVGDIYYVVYNTAFMAGTHLAFAGRVKDITSDSRTMAGYAFGRYGHAFKNDENILNANLTLKHNQVQIEETGEDAGYTGPCEIIDEAEEFADELVEKGFLFRRPDFLSLLGNLEINL